MGKGGKERGERRAERVRGSYEESRGGTKTVSGLGDQAIDIG